MKPMDYSTKRTITDDIEVAIYSKKQQKVFDAATQPDTDTKRSKIIMQWPDGDILVHHFFLNEGRWLGYAQIIGPRGGSKVTHGHYVIRRDGDLFLSR